MAKKSAAQAKVVKPQIGTPQIPKPEEIWDEFLTVENVKIDAQMRQLDRVDTLVTLRSTYKEFYGEFPLIADIHELALKVKDMFSNYKDILNAIKLEDLVNPEMDDPFADMIAPGIDCANWDDVLCEFVIFQYLQPYASQLGQVHQKIVAAAEAHSDDE